MMRYLSNDPGYLPENHPRQWSNTQLAAWLDTIPAANAHQSDILDEAAKRLRGKHGFGWRIWRRVAVVMTRNAGTVRAVAIDLSALVSIGLCLGALSLWRLCL